ncbi:MAG: YCF48-related protein [Candidatus Sulfotelmatobacter sp.]
MTELSKVVRERLKVKTAAMASHPDADLLTAFAERSLAERERAHVMEHLARCGDCREIVMLALPGQVENTAVARSGLRGDWFRMPVLRWAAVAVGIAAAVSVGTLEYRSQPMRSLSSKVGLRQETAATLREPSPVANVPAETAASPAEMKNTVPAKKLEAAAGPPAESRTVAAIHGSAIGGSLAGATGVGFDAVKVREAPRRDLAMADAAKSMPPAPALSAQSAAPAPSRPTLPAASEAVEVATASAAVETEQAELGSNKEVLSRAKPPVNQQIVSGTSSLPTQGRNAANMQTPYQPQAAPRWNISAEGTLQRSFDGGASWQAVNVAGSESVSTNLMLNGTDETRKTAVKKSLDKRLTTAPSQVFRAVAATGMEVWVGGSSGLLYHTVDAGNSWARVVPSYEGVVLGGDIVGIEFADPQHGRLSTSTGEIWTTGDGGQTWQKIK